jgi:hypothetical protein
MELLDLKKEWFLIEDRYHADELLNASKPAMALFYLSFHTDSAADQAKRRENLINRLGQEFLDPEGRLAVTRPLHLPGSFAGRRNEERFRMEDRCG